MRVVSGDCKGRPLKPVPGSSTRPTTDKVKESIFNMIGPYFNGGIGLDLFGGSGSLGVEALSRGIDKVVFIDRDIKAVQTIRKNVETCHFTERAEVYRNDAERALKALFKRKLAFDLIFLDPPYKQQKIKELIELICKNNLIKVNGYIVSEHSEEVALPNKIDSLHKIKCETYGITAVSVFSYKGEREE